MASNGDLVARAATILSAMNVKILGPAEVREKLKLRKRGKEGRDPESLFRKRHLICIRMNAGCSNCGALATIAFAAAVHRSCMVSA